MAPDWLPELDGLPPWLWLPLDPWAPELPDEALSLPEELELELELLELEELLLEELELLEDEGLPLLEGGEELGVEGVCGWVGLLELGQPDRSRHRAATRIALADSKIDLLFNVIGPGHVLGFHRLSLFKTGPESGFPQGPHQAVGQAVVCLVFVQAFKIHHTASRRHAEF